jgi:hypothetical protein
MNTSLRLFISALGFCTIIASSGCGGGGGGGDDDNVAVGANTPPANSQLAPGTIAGRSIEFTHAGGVVVVDTFAADGNNFAGNAHDSAASQNGTYSYTRSGNTATLIQQYEGGDEVWTHRLTFESSQSGSFTEESTQGQTGSGTFRFIANNLPAP